MLELAFLPILILLSAFFSGSEIALFSITDSRVRALVDEQRPGSSALQRLKNRPERLLATILLVTISANVVAAVLTTSVALRTYGDPGIAWAAGLVVFLVLVFGEITPKGLAMGSTERVALRVAGPVLLLSRILAPLVIPLEWLTKWFSNRSRKEGQVGVTEGEMREMTAIGNGEMVNEQERRIIERAFRLDESRAWDIMTPRVDILAWPADRPLSAIISELPLLRFSRVPIYRDSVDDIVGILYTRDAYQALVSGHRDVPLADLAREPFFVPGSIPLTRLLSDFQTRRIHMGIVIDEYGGTDGLVTLEDILEELVGEINDETDLDYQPVIRLSRDEILVEGATDLREINHFFGTNFPQLEHRSLNGYLLDEVGHVPPPGERVEREGVTITVVASSETQVLQARLTRGVPVGEEAGGASGSVDDGEPTAGAMRTDS